MPHIVTDKCQSCRFTDCVTTCPVACFHGDGQMLYIDNVQCVDCGACVPACPVHAIYEQTELPTGQTGMAGHQCAARAHVAHHRRQASTAAHRRGAQA